MDTRNGVLFGIGAYVFWGLTPLFWNLIDDIGAVNLLTNRIVWSIPVLLLILAVQRRFKELRLAFSSGATIAFTVFAALLLAINWGVWLFAITNEQIVEGSLGYFINPLVSVALGVVILRETLRRLQWVAVGIATIGVIGMAIGVGTPPWIALVLAFSFGTYGLVKKRPEIAAPLISLMGEILVLAVPAVFVLVAFSNPDDLNVSDGLTTTLFMVATGIVTTVPLLLFGAAAKRVPLTTVGLLQYIAPTLQLMVGVFVFGESLEAGRLVWFIVVWIALGVLAYDSLKGASDKRASTGVTSQ
jgi:chloramphenicol-sensitive protein RarD